MSELTLFLQSLNQDEILAVRTALQRSSGAGGLLLEKLFDLVSSPKGKTMTEKALSHALYKMDKPRAFAMIRSRLFYFVLDVLSSDHVLYRLYLLDPGDQQSIRVRKRMLQFRILYRKRNRAGMAVLYHLLSEIIQEAKHMEQYDVLVDALYFKKYFLMMRKGFKDVEAIEKQIQHYKYAYQALLRANDDYFDLITNKYMIAKAKPDHILQLVRNSIKELQEYARVTGSAMITYACKRLQLEEQIRTGNHSSTISLCLEIISLLKKNPVISRKELLGFAYDNISQCQVHKGEFSRAVTNARKAQLHYNKKSISYLLSKNQEFYAFFYGGHYTKALAVIRFMLKFPLVNMGEFRHDKFLLMQACTLFRLGKKKQALRICEEALEITKDKGRWDTGMRYLRIMCMIELDDDRAEDAIEALRKVLERGSKQGVTSLRDDLIYKALYNYAVSSYSELRDHRLNNFLQRLSAKEGAYTWNYYSHELIPVHEWLLSRTRARQ